MINWYMNLTVKQYWRTFQIGSVVLALGSSILVFLKYISLMEFLLIAFLPRTFFKFLRFKTHRHEFPKEASFRTAFIYIIIALVLWFVFDIVFPSIISFKPSINL
jgi:hypothetical protein